MKTLLCLSLVFAASARADEIGDRLSISAAIVSLNFRSDLTAIAESPIVADEIRAVQAAMVAPHTEETPYVIISHEPWGEATIGTFTLSSGGKLYCGPIRFLTPEVALADATITQPGDSSIYKPVLFVMKRVGDSWKIASARMLAVL